MLLPKLKLALVAFFLGLISAAGTHSGLSSADWLAALAVVVKPILFLLALIYLSTLLAQLKT